MVSKRKIRQVVAHHIMFRGECRTAAYDALNDQNYSAAAALCQLAEQQQQVIDALEGLLS